MAQNIIGALRTSLDNNKMVRFAVFAGLLAVIGGSAYYGYRIYRNRVQEDAQKLLAEALAQYRVYGLSDEYVDFTEAARMFQEGYDRSKSSTLAPLFLVYEADALARAHKLDEASETLKKALDQLPKDWPFYDLYQLKKLLLDIDIQCGKECSAVPGAAVHELEKIAYDKSHNFRELALNYLVDFYKAVGRQQDAQKAADELDKITNVSAPDFLGSLV